MADDIARIEKRIIELEGQMDSVMQLSRAVIRFAGKAITAMHARHEKEAGEFLSSMSESMKRLKATEQGFEHYSLPAHQEYTEAMIVYNIIKNGKVPPMGEIGEAEIPYLLGMMDAVGELKREAFESMRKRDLATASMYYSLMLEIYDSTAHLRFAGALVPDFRKKQDTARIQIEGTISELVSLEGKAR
jgi:translin